MWIKTEVAQEKIDLDEADKMNLEESHSPHAPNIST